MSDSHLFPQTSSNPVAAQDEIAGHVTAIVAAIVWTELQTIHDEAERINEAARLALLICNAVARKWKT